MVERLARLAKRGGVKRRQEIELNVVEKDLNTSAERQRHEMWADRETTLGRGENGLVEVEKDHAMAPMTVEHRSRAVGSQHLDFQTPLLLPVVIAASRMDCSFYRQI